MNRKSSLAGYLLWLLCFVGICGIHRIYLGRPLTGLLWLFTAGLLGIGQLIDLFLIPGMAREENLKDRLGMMERERRRLR